ncbi:IclR family transcriptional regulator [Streptomyces sp. NPDC048277]|uniref:IclR family transcriptional regulator n=1 Tax=Streptomyces sp. NPDC048277 TaxID=3155027 RepID=UPI0033FC51DF
MTDTNSSEDLRDQVGQPVQSVDRALTLLNEFRDRSSLTVSEAAAILEVSKSTAHRLLAMLQLHGFVRQDERSKAYLSGPALIQVGLAAFTKLDIRAAAQPSLDALADSTGETAHLVVLEDTHVLFIDGRESRQELRAGLRIGASRLAHLTATGTALLGTLSATELQRYWSRASKDAAASPATTWDDLLRGVLAAKERGYVVNEPFMDPGIRAVASPIPWSGSGTYLRAGIAVAGPEGRMPAERLTLVAAEVTREAEMIGARLPLV